MVNQSRSALERQLKITEEQLKYAKTDRERQSLQLKIDELKRRLKQAK